MNYPIAPSAFRGGSAFVAPARRAILGLCLVAVLAPITRAQRAPARTNLTELSLEELMEVEVTTVSKHREKLTNAPAAVFALNADDLQRAGVQTLPDALRLVPGVQVGRVDSHNWAISARGFADVFSNKLLVLQDGRSLYTPLFSGVFWEAQDTMLEDVERIEVVRGPGATLWGANAVNGVINILSKPANETQGSLGAVTVGTDPQFSARARYGGEIDKNTHFRVYGKFTRYDNSPAVGGGRTQDDWHSGQTGFRIDRQNDAGNIFTLQGDAYRVRAKETYLLPPLLPPLVSAPPPAGVLVIPSFSNNAIDGANLLARSTQHIAGGELMVQGYFDYTGRDTTVFGETRRTYDFEAQHRFTIANQELTLGAGFRSTSDSVHNTPYITLTPPRRTVDLWNAFVQDEISLSKDTHLILGSKLEHNEFTGWEVQPGARLLWTPNEQNTFWGSVARAVRTPSRAEDDITIRQITAVPGVSATLNGNRAIRSEELVAYEAGWRMHAREKFSLDVAGFVNRYERIRTTELTPLSAFTLNRLLTPIPASSLPPPGAFTLVANAGNGVHGETYGGEIAVAAQLAPGWRVRASYSHLDIALHLAPGNLDISTEHDEGRSPRDQGYLWSQHDLPGGQWRFDWVVRAVGRLATTQIPAYVTADARLAWRPADGWEISVAGRNLLDPHHQEFLPATIFTPLTETPRSGSLEIKYGF